MDFGNGFLSNSYSANRNKSSILSSSLRLDDDDINAMGESEVFVSDRNESLNTNTAFAMEGKAAAQEESVTSSILHNGNNNIKEIPEYDDEMPAEEINEIKALFEEAESDMDLQSEVKATSTSITEDELLKTVFSPGFIPDDSIETIESIEVIEGTPYSREHQGRIKNQKAIKEATFGTEYVAEQLGVTSQAVRNYVDDYNEWLNVEILPNGRRLFTVDKIEKLRKIIQFKTEHCYTTARMQAFLRNPDSGKSVAPIEERMEEMFGKLQLAMQQNMMESMRAFAGELLENNQKMLEMKESINNQVVDELKEQVQEQSNAISELLGLVKAQTQANTEENKNHTEETLRVIEELQKTIEQKDKKVEELTVAVTKKQEEYDYLKKTTRKKIFGVF